MLIAVLALIVVAVLILKELVALRRQVSSIRQFLEWWAVGFLETRRDALTPAMQNYIEKTKQDLVRDGMREGTLSEQQVNDLKTQHR